MTKNPNDYSFVEHWDELRTRLLRYLAVLGIAVFLAWPFGEAFLEMIVAPVGHVVFTFPAEAFMARLSVTLALGFFLSLPVLFYEIWKFIGAALTSGERRHIFALAPFSLALFVAGILFGFFVIVPVSMRFFLSFSSESLMPMITVNQYISFVGTMVFAAGIIFELPLALMFLIKLGIATPSFLAHYRKHVIIAVFILSAILTPPDVFSQLLLAVPFLALYELGIILARFYKP